LWGQDASMQYVVGMGLVLRIDRMKRCNFARLSFFGRTQTTSSVVVADQLFFWFLPGIVSLHANRGIIPQCQCENGSGHPDVAH
jgi:hypothetical protein